MRRTTVSAFLSWVLMCSTLDFSFAQERAESDSPKAVQEQEAASREERLAALRDWFLEGSPEQAGELSLATWSVFESFILSTTQASSIESSMAQLKTKYSAKNRNEISSFQQLWLEWLLAMERLDLDSLSDISVAIDSAYANAALDVPNEFRMLLLVGHQFAEEVERYVATWEKLPSGYAVEILRNSIAEPANRPFALRNVVWLLASGMLGDQDFQSLKLDHVESLAIKTLLGRVGADSRRAYSELSNDELQVITELVKFSYDSVVRQAGSSGGLLSLLDELKARLSALNTRGRAQEFVEQYSYLMEFSFLSKKAHTRLHSARDMAVVSLTEETLQDGGVFSDMPAVAVGLLTYGLDFNRGWSGLLDEEVDQYMDTVYPALVRIHQAVRSKHLNDPSEGAFGLGAEYDVVNQALTLLRWIEGREHGNRLSPRSRLSDALRLRQALRAEAFPNDLSYSEWRSAFVARLPEEFDIESIEQALQDDYKQICLYFIHSPDIFRDPDDVLSWISAPWVQNDRQVAALSALVTYQVITEDYCIELSEQTRSTLFTFLIENVDAFLDLGWFDERQASFLELLFLNRDSLPEAHLADLSAVLLDYDAEHLSSIPPEVPVDLLALGIKAKVFIHKLCREPPVLPDNYLRGIERIAGELVESHPEVAELWATYLVDLLIRGDGLDDRLFTHFLAVLSATNSNHAFTGELARLIAHVAHDHSLAGSARATIDNAIQRSHKSFDVLGSEKVLAAYGPLYGWDNDIVRTLVSEATGQLAPELSGYVPGKVARSEMAIPHSEAVWIASAVGYLCTDNWIARLIDAGEIEELRAVIDDLGACVRSLNDFPHSSSLSRPLILDTIERVFTDLLESGPDWVHAQCFPNYVDLVSELGKQRLTQQGKGSIASAALRAVECLWLGLSELSTKGKDFENLATLLAAELTPLYELLVSTDAPPLINDHLISAQAYLLLEERESAAQSAESAISALMDSNGLYFATIDPSEVDTFFRSRCDLLAEAVDLYLEAGGQSAYVLAKAAEYRSRCLLSALSITVDRSRLEIGETTHLPSRLVLIVERSYRFRRVLHSLGIETSVDASELQDTNRPQRESYLIAIRDNAILDSASLGDSTELRDSIQHYSSRLAQYSSLFAFAPPSEGLLRVQERELALLAQSFASKISAAVCLLTSEESRDFAPVFVLGPEWFESFPVAATPLEGWEDGAIQYLAEVANLVQVSKLSYEKTYSGNVPGYFFWGPPEFANNDFSALSMFRESIGAIATQLRADGANISEKLGIASTAEALKQSSPHDVVVLVTHGISSPANSDMSLGPISELGQSHIVCAADELGASELVTAADLLQLRVMSSQTVALIACNTDTGAPRQGFGRLGLRAGVVLAGAQTVVSTLWNVAEHESVDFVRAFSDELNQSKDPVEAFGSASRMQLELVRERHGVAHPYWWAGYSVSHCFAGTQ